MLAKNGANECGCFSGLVRSFLRVFFSVFWGKDDRICDQSRSGGEPVS